MNKFSCSTKITGSPSGDTQDPRGRPHLARTRPHEAGAAMDHRQPVLRFTLVLFSSIGTVQYTVLPVQHYCFWRHKVKSLDTRGGPAGQWLGILVSHIGAGCSEHTAVILNTGELGLQIQRSSPTYTGQRQNRI